ncbi:MAG: hypothetical protein Q8Q09_06125 [Deltaproteobacteria bacterium]|nr:hypothetical protein [Deltaproteobacteria bacterium]
MNRLVLVASVLLWIAGCADPCGRRCPNDPERSASETASCRDTQSRIASATGLCANEVRAANACSTTGYVCNSSGRSEAIAGRCDSQLGAAVECCIRNIGRAPACALR